MCLRLKLREVSVPLVDKPSLSFVAPISPIVLTVDCDIIKGIVWMFDFICFFIFHLQHKSSSVSVVFALSISPRNVVAVSLILLPVISWRKERKVIVYGRQLCFLSMLCLHLRLSEERVVFILNASLSADAPLHPILLPVYQMESTRSNCDHVCYGSENGPD